MKSIKSRILLFIILLVVIPTISVGIVSVCNTYVSTMDEAHESMSELAISTAERIHYQLESYLNVARTAGTNAAFTDEDISVEEKKEMLDTLAEHRGFERGNIIGEDGLSIFNGQDFSERDYYQRAMRGESYISDPLLSKVTGEYAIIVAAPLWKDGIEGGDVVGCIYFAPPPSFLIDIMRSVEIGGECSAYMINHEGVIIADKKDDTVPKQISIIQNAQEYPQYAELAAIHVKMINKETGCEKYNSDMGETLVAYTPVESKTGGWYLALEVPMAYFFASATTSIFSMACVALGFCIVASIIATIISNSIVKPIIVCTERIRKLAEGDVTSSALHSTSPDEVGVLARSTEKLVYNLRAIINDIDRILSATADADLSIDVEENAAVYVGDLSTILDAMKNINKGLSVVIRNINNSSIQVSVGSDQVSAAAQSLAQGTTEQASSVQELAATISDIAVKTGENLNECNAATDAVNVSATLMQEANAHMKNMTAAMDRINAASDKIEKIMKSIEDIAFQTNILSINAAVEAAKVGEAGKGFAVVAEEVGNLASKSHESAKSTAALIAESSNAVKDGMKIAEETAETLNKVVEASAEVIKIVSKVAEYSSVQAESIQQVSIGMDQISSVVQTNSATAEESAAASEELNQQSMILKGMVEKFKLSEEWTLT